MFEPQDHPNDLAYPGGPPVAPYDAADAGNWPSQAAEYTASAGGVQSNAVALTPGG